MNSNFDKTRHDKEPNPITNMSIKELRHRDNYYLTLWHTCMKATMQARAKFDETAKDVYGIKIPIKMWSGEDNQFSRPEHKEFVQEHPDLLELYKDLVRKQKNEARLMIVSRYFNEQLNKAMAEDMNRHWD